MKYKKGDIFYYDYPKRKTKEIQKSKVIADKHRVVVLHTRETPYKTILVAPITSSNGLKEKNNIPNNYVKLDKRYYPFLISKDCYINLDHIMPIDRDELQDLISKNIKIKGSLKEIDLYQIDLKLMITYEMQCFFESEQTLEQNQNIKTIIDHINLNVKKDLEDLLDKFKIKEYQERKEFIEILDSMIDTLKTYYINDKAIEGHYIKNT